MTSSRLSVRHPVVPGDPADAASCLAAVSGLSKGAVKEAMGKGAVWLARAGRGTYRLRRIKATVRPGDVLEIHYDAAILAQTPAEARLVRDPGRWSAWWKPAGLLSQGTPFGDHVSLLRQAELRLARPVFLVHRLDREAEGLVLVAHDGPTAAGLSAQFREGRVEKLYRAEVAGDVAARLGPEGIADEPLSGKPATTRWRVVSFDAARPSTVLSVTIDTGRQHQIRRHLASLGHPVIGDPRYGTGNKDGSGLRLAAVGLRFRDPATGEDVTLALEELTRADGTSRSSGPSAPTPGPPPS